MLDHTTFVQKFRDCVCRKTHLEHIFPELPNIYLSQNIKPVLELYEQRLFHSNAALLKPYKNYFDHVHYLYQKDGRAMPENLQNRTHGFLPSQM
jgi:hypothetical protein